MDRYDEKRDRLDDDDDVTPRREGDILGLGGGPVPKAPDDPSAERERERGAGEERFEDVERHGTADAPRSSGATGIDMGSGGSGTDVTGR